MARCAIALTLSMPLWAQAESAVTAGTGSAAARLDFRVVIPRVLFMAVGTGASGTALTANSTIDAVSFDYTGAGATVGNGTAQSSAAIAVRVVGNNGQVTITATNPASLSTGGATPDTIPFTQLSVTSSDNVNLPAAAFSGGTSLPKLTGTKLTNVNANWTYAYANSITPAAGTYTGQVTYTATMP